MHSLTDFKNFARAELNLFDPLTVLLGRNGSGRPYPNPVLRQ